MVRAFVVKPDKQNFILSRSRGISPKKIFPKEISWILKGAFPFHKFLHIDASTINTLHAESGTICETVTVLFDPVSSTSWVLPGCPDTHAAQACFLPHFMETSRTRVPFVRCAAARLLLRYRGPKTAECVEL
jgi:hypothetical protein